MIPIPRERPTGLADMGASLSAKFAELGLRPSPDKCDYLLRDLHEAMTAIAQMRDRLLRGESPSA